MAEALLGVSLAIGLACLAGGVGLGQRRDTLA
jgi:F0F1-type ATP synthase membrane subunit c/vacuolar-type H+-ATPase subunit K